MKVRGLKLEAIAKKNKNLSKIAKYNILSYPYKKNYESSQQARKNWTRYKREVMDETNTKSDDGHASTDPQVSSSMYLAVAQGCAVKIGT